MNLKYPYWVAVYISLLATSINMGEVRYRDGLRVLVWLLFLMAVPIAEMAWRKKFNILGLLISLWLFIHSAFWFLAIRRNSLLWPTWIA